MATGLTDEEAQKLCAEPDPITKGFYMQQTMYRIKDPKKSLDFYTRVLGMRLLMKFDMPAMKFTVYFMGYANAEDIPTDKVERMMFAMKQKGLIELTHNWGSETDDKVVYHTGNTEPRGFGHIGVAVPNVYAACKKFEELGIQFIKKPDDGTMKGLAFIKDPDGYWIEILSPTKADY